MHTDTHTNHSMTVTVCPFSMSLSGFRMPCAHQHKPGLDVSFHFTEDCFAAALFTAILLFRKEAIKISYWLSLPMWNPWIIDSQGESSHRHCNACTPNPRIQAQNMCVSLFLFLFFIGLFDQIKFEMSEIIVLELEYWQNIVNNCLNLSLRDNKEEGSLSPWYRFSLLPLSAFHCGSFSS